MKLKTEFKYDVDDLTLTLKREEQSSDSRHKYTCRTETSLLTT